MAIDGLTKKIMATGQIVSSDRYPISLLATSEGNLVTKENAIPVNISASSTSTGADAFGRLRTSETRSLFESFHRFRDNGLWVEKITGTASSTFSPNEGLVLLDVGTAVNDEIIRETIKVFSYHPGKSLLVMKSFVLAPAKNNLRQRIGLFGEKNGFYIEQENTSLSIVKRTYTSGSVENIKIPQEDWNYDKMDGTGPSGILLDSSKAQIMWMDMEWLGVGTVRVGFIIDGALYLCHSFHHANIINSTYTTTACLPLRQEITNIGETISNSTAKQICSTVSSEGGYSLTGKQSVLSTPITSPRITGAAGVYFPVASIRLKSTDDNLDAIVILTSIALMGGGNLHNYSWKILSNSTTTDGEWLSLGPDSLVEYNSTGTLVTGGNTLSSGFFSSSQQSNQTIYLSDSLFKFQLERNSFTSTPYEICLAVVGGTNNQPIFGTLEWEEITR